MPRSTPQRTRRPLEAPEDFGRTLEIVPRNEDADRVLGRRSMLAEIVQRVLAQTRASGAALALESHGRVVCCARAGESAPTLGAKLDREAGLSGLCLRTGQTVRCDHVFTDPRVDSEAARGLGIFSILAVPIKLGGATIGLLELFSQSPYAFGEAEEALLDQASQDILNALAHEPSQDQWQAVLEITSEQVTTAPDPAVTAPNPPATPSELDQPSTGDNVAEEPKSAIPKPVVEAMPPAPFPTAVSSESADDVLRDVRAAVAEAEPSDPATAELLRERETIPAPAEPRVEPGEPEPARLASEQESRAGFESADSREPLFSDTLTLLMPQDVDSAPKRRPILLLIAVLAVLAMAGLAVSLRTSSTRVNAAAKASKAAPAPTAVESLQSAAEEGDVTAQLNLARRYREGDGVERNGAEAVRWLQQAARLGNADAQYELGNAYADGRGVPRDPINAYACFVLASANGNAAGDEALRFLTPKLSDAQIATVRSTIGDMYLQGRGTPVDYVAAYTWFRLAESAGNAGSQRARQELASKMTKRQVAAAERRASEWLKRHPQQAR